MYIPKRKVVCAMITEIDFKVKGEERKKLAYAIGESLGMPVKYTRTPKFDYLIGDCILDKNGVFHASGDLSESKLELILERFYKGERIQQLELPEDETVKADVLHKTRSRRSGETLGVIFCLGIVLEREK